MRISSSWKGGMDETPKDTMIYHCHLQLLACLRGDIGLYKILGRAFEAKIVGRKALKGRRQT